MYREAMDMILDLENAIDVDNVRFGDFNYWPVVRSAMFNKFLQTVRGMTPAAQGPRLPVQDSTGNQDLPAVELNFTAPAETGLVHFDADEVRRVFEGGAMKPDILVFCRHEEMDQTIAGTHFARYLDSIFEVALEQFNAVKVVDLTIEAFAQQRYLPCMFLHANHYMETTQVGDIDLNGFEQIEQYLKPRGTHIFLGDRDAVLRWLVPVLKLAHGFQNMLEHFKPRLVICSTYWHLFGHALMLAAHRLGIPTVDVQHGRLGPDHGAYTEYTKIPEGGFEIMPDKIWCWGEITRQDIERGRPANCTVHTPIVGGNPWFERWPRTRQELALEDPLERLEQEAAGRKKILLSLQPSEAPLTDLMLSTMESVPKDWVWLVRTHPRQKHSKADIASLLDQRNIAHIGLESVSELPLYAALELVDHHTTHYSSTAVDALDFGVRTTLFEGPGREVFRSFLAAGEMTIASSAETAVSIILSHLTDGTVRNSESFLTKWPGLTRRTLQHLLEG